MTASRRGTTRPVLTAKAFAKINLDLRVLDVRPDGYHELRTTFQSIALADTLTFRSTRTPLRIECDDPACPAGRRNLVWRAAARMWKAAKRRGLPRGLTIQIAKRIPVQAGLGGGSSDAAAALRALAVIWRVQISSAELHQMASELGADVPFFLEGGTALGVGRGDRLFPLDDIARAWVVLVIPDFAVNTKDAFGWWDRTRGRLRGADSNDLQAPVAERHPVVKRLVAALKRGGAFHASLSGSGSAVYGLFPSRPGALRAARALDGSGRRTIVVRTLDRGECRALAAT